MQRRVRPKRPSETRTGGVACGRGAAQRRAHLDKGLMDPAKIVPTTLVISDLHITTGEPPDAERPLWKRYKQADLFVDERIGRMLRAARAEATGPIELVLDGDIFDFDAVTELPRDGRFRMSWQVGENATGFYDAGPQQPATGAFKDQSKPPKSPEANGLRKMNYSKETLGNVYSVHNNLPYAERLAADPPHSKQAAPGWVQLIAKNAQSYAIAQAAKIGRQS